MVLSPRFRKYWATIQLDRKIVISRMSILPSFVAVLVFCTVVYLLWLPLAIFFSTLQSLFSSHAQPVRILTPGIDAIKHFAGSQECNILQSNIYHAPYSTNPKVSPFCSSRATLLKALSNGGRYGFDEPYVGKACTYRWFATPEICAILERFSTIVFVGDDIARVVYLAFNILLREDVALGGLQEWGMSQQDRENCKCDNQFLDHCLAYGVRSSDDIKQDVEGKRKGGPYICSRIPHAYISVDSVPTPPAAVKSFRDLTYMKPNPWQPCPVIFSFGHSSFDVGETSRALDEWLTLALAAERNVPLLFLSPPTISSAESNFAPWQYHQRMSSIANRKHVDLLGLYNLTLQASTPDGGRFGESVALVEAMMIINWLSKLETS